MKNSVPKSVAGVAAPATRPTLLGAGVFAAIVTFPLGVALLLVDWLVF